MRATERKKVDSRTSKVKNQGRRQNKTMNEMSVPQKRDTVEEKKKVNLTSFETHFHHHHLLDTLEIVDSPSVASSMVKIVSHGVLVSPLPQG